MSVKLETSSLRGFVTSEEIREYQQKVLKAEKQLHEKNGKGGEFTGWVTLPEDYNKEEFSRILKAAEKINKHSRHLIVIGIGGSYLGARAGIEFLKTPFYNNIPGKNTPSIYFAGNNLSANYLNALLEIIGEEDFSVNVVSKSGTTTEPAIAFRIFREKLIQKYGHDGARARIFATTDKERGSLKKLCDEEGYETFTIPDDIGGRYSVLTAVGLLPFAAAGIDIQAMLLGARDAKIASENADIFQNDCFLYAAVRNILYHKDKTIELVANYEPGMTMLGEWQKQLFGESEGKQQGGTFPASVSFTTDLHSMGQYIQDGRRNLFETVLFSESSETEIVLTEDKDNIDNLNFLKGKNLQFVNEKAFQGTMLAHVEGGVPNMALKISKMDEYHLGYLFYFFEKACALSSYLLDINPFDQPGVESYKKNMFALLGKPGYEKEKEELLSKLEA